MKQPTLTATDFAKRRAVLMRRIGPGGVAILATAPETIRNQDVHHPYRPNSDFYYLTGFAEPDAVAVLVPGREAGAYSLFCRPRDPQAELWQGRRAGVEGALAEFGADAAYPLAELDIILPKLLETAHRLYYALGTNPSFDSRVLGWLNQLRTKVRAGVQVPREIHALDDLIHEQRLRKQTAELKLMRQAADISVAAHRRAMRMCQPGLWEYQIEAELLHEFMRCGALSPAYPSIVGGGANACILHYRDNNQRLRDGELLLIDAGAEYQYYAADITRTFPVNGRFSPEQRALYELVLAAQTAAIAAVKPGNPWDAPHQAAVTVLAEGLLRLGLLQGTLAEVITQETYKRYFMHKTGHWLGMDVHDVGNYKRDGAWRCLEPGMVLTVEPGLYIAADSPVDARWWNIGIRIEDDVVVTRTGCEVLTEAAPKTVAAIEAEMAR